MKLALKTEIEVMEHLKKYFKKANSKDRNANTEQQCQLACNRIHCLLCTVSEQLDNCT